MTSDQDIKGLLTTAAEGEPPPTAGPTDVFRAARTIQRRRRLANGLTGAGVLGVLVAVGVVVGTSGHPGDGNGGTPPDVAGSGRTSESAPPQPSGADALQTMRGLLPRQLRVSDERADKGFAHLVLSDAGGRTAVEVNIEPDFTGSAGKISGGELLDRYDCGKRTDPAGTRCTASVLPDKTRVVSIDGPAGESDPGVVRRQVDALSADGLRVVVTAWNAADPRSGPVTRQVPVLDDRQLQDIATSQRWRIAPATESTGTASPAGGGRVN
jgi:hypothetical protein